VKSLRILIVAHDFPPLNSSAAHRPYSWARTWTDAGHDIHVLTTAKYAHDGRVDLSHDLSGISVHGVPYLRGAKPLAPDATPSGSGRAGKLEFIRRATRRLRAGLGPFAQIQVLAYRPLLRAGLELVAHERFDLIVSTSGPDICPLVASRLAARAGVPWLSDYRDLWFPEFAVDRYAVTNYVVDRLNRRLLRQPIAVSTVSEGLAGYLRGLVHCDVWVCYNGFLDVDPSRLPPPPAPDGRLHVVYTGNFYPRKRDPGVFLDALRDLAAADPALSAKLRVEFYGPEEVWVRRLIDERGLGALVALNGNVPYAASLARQRAADLLLFVDWMDPRAKGVLTGKLFEYFAACRPILCVGDRPDTEAAQLIRDCGAGRVAVSREDIRAAISDLLRRVYGVAPDPAAVYRFSRRAQAEALLERVTAKLEQLAPGKDAAARVAASARG